MGFFLAVISGDYFRSFSGDYFRSFEASEITASEIRGVHFLFLIFLEPQNYRNNRQK